MAEAHAALGPCLAEVEMLEEAEDRLGGEEDRDDGVADDLVVAGCHSQGFGQADAQCQTDDDENDA